GSERGAQRYQQSNDDGLEDELSRHRCARPSKQLNRLTSTCKKRSNQTSDPGICGRWSHLRWRALEADVLSNSIIVVRFCIRTRRDSLFVPAKAAGTQRPQTGTLDSRLRGNKRRRDPVRIRTSGTNTKANGALQ